MPVGTGATLLQMIPADPFVMDPAMFFGMTTKNIDTRHTQNDPGEGQQFVHSMEKVGIKSKLRIVFEGEMVVSTAAATSSMDWPYGLLDLFRLSANANTDLFSCDGIDLHALRFVRYPAYSEQIDQFPGTVGGGDTINTGTYALSLCWEVPIAVDDTTLIGSLFAQSGAANLNYTIRRALNTRLFSANPGNVAIDGDWKVQETWFGIPFDDEGRLVVPDLTRLHGFAALDTQFQGTGERPVGLVRQAGQLHRLFFSAQSSATNRLTGDPSAASTKKITALRLQYGGNQRPIVYDPASLILTENQVYYGGLVPYDRHVFDFVRENPIRDLVNLLGVTELEVVPTIGSGVTVTAGQVRVAQETLS